MKKCYIDDYDPSVVSKKCFSCHVEGIIINRVISARFGKYKTRNAINMCKNPDCYRYMDRIPSNWVHEDENIHYEIPRNKIYNSRKSRQFFGESNPVHKDNTGEFVE